MTREKKEIVLKNILIKFTAEFNPFHYSLVCVPTTDSFLSQYLNTQSMMQL